jgi:lipoprotein-anchoring transpeptidase ErfK/SrfK
MPPESMRSKSFMAVAGVLVVLLVLAGGTVAYDSGRKDTVAKGITIAGVDIGGLERPAAEQRVRSRLAQPLMQPVMTHFHGRRYQVNPENLGVAVDVPASVTAALDRSRDGGILGRTVRNLTGGSVNDDLDVEVTYDRDAVARRVSRLASHIDRPAQDADVDISTAGVKVVKSQRGLKVNTRALTRQLTRTLTSAAAQRDVRIPARSIKPKVTTKEVAQKYPKVIVVNRGAFSLTLYDHLEAVKTYRIAVGMAGLETPAGLYSIQDKQINPYWHVPQSDWAGSLAGQVIPPGPSNPIKARWMGIYNGAGIHGTDSVGSLGTAASHGCVRMAIPDVEDLYDRVDVGTPVYIG